MTLAFLSLIFIGGVTLWKVNNMATAMEDLKAQVLAMSTVVDSAVELIHGIADRIDDAIATDDAAEDGELGALADELRADAALLGDAIAANTVASEEVEPLPTDEPTDDEGSDDGEGTGDQPIA